MKHTLFISRSYYVLLVRSFLTTWFEQQPFRPFGLVLVSNFWEMMGPSHMVVTELHTGTCGHVIELVIIKLLQVAKFGFKQRTTSLLPSS